uniref:Katanin catalytic subunit A1 like 2 n=1 Tax=Pavo cristatus TaxID=9049 RepID=A0A8C9F6L3_PAVCR
MCAFAGCCMLSSYLHPQDELRAEARRKNLLILILHYLMEEGYRTVPYPSVNAAQDTVGLLGCECTLLPRVLQLLLCQNLPKAALMEFFSQSVHTSGIALTQHPALGLFEPHWIHMGTLFQPVQDPLDDIPFFCCVHVPLSLDIYLHNPNVKWDDIIGLDAAKRLVKEAVVYPIRYPQLFTGILSPWKGLLLYGPPGMEIFTTLPVVCPFCFCTTNESLMLTRSHVLRYSNDVSLNLGSGEHEGSRRMKTELLVQMDGLARSDDLVFVLAASNLLLQKKPVRKVFDALESHQPGNSNLATIRLDTITTADFLDVITHTKPSAKKLSQKYTAWQREFESV